MASAPALDEFLAGARRFLADHYPRASRREDNAFAWGRGSDEVRVFQEPDPVAEAGLLPQIRAWRALLWEHGYGWISGPPEYGGGGLPGSYQRAFETLTREFEVPGDSSLTIGLGMIAPTILRHGSEEQKQRYLPVLYRGDLIACQLFSEPGAGSDLASVATRARRDGDGWRITGQKVWTSGAHIADVGEIICKTADEPRHGNLTTFLIGMHAPGVTVRPLRQMTGGAAFNEVFLDEVYVPDADRLGAEGGGWPVALTTLTFERGAMGHSAFGGAGILSTDRLVALTRHCGRDQDPVTRRDFGALITRLRVARYTQQVLAARRANGPELALGKLALSANMTAVGDYVSGILGGAIIGDTGEWGTYAWTSVVLGAPGYRLGGGTDEILKNNVAQRVLGLPRPGPAQATAPPAKREP